METPLQKAVRLLKGQTKVAEICGVKQQTVSYWLNEREGLIPPKYAIPVEKAIDGLADNAERVTRGELCPDFPWEQLEA